jgi:hypothetical protein
MGNFEHRRDHQQHADAPLDFRPKNRRQKREDGEKQDRDPKAIAIPCDVEPG